MITTDSTPLCFVTASERLLNGSASLIVIKGLSATIPTEPATLDAEPGDMVVLGGIWSETPPAWIVSDLGTLERINWNYFPFPLYRSAAKLHFQDCPVLKA